MCLSLLTTASFSPQILKKEEAIPWPGTLAIVHSYIAYKEGDKRTTTPYHMTRAGTRTHHGTLSTT